MIHSSAVISEKAVVGDRVSIGPFCVVGEGVVLHDDVELKSHVSIVGDTEVGDGTVIYPFASIGQIPQDLKYGGEKSRIRIGKRNHIREHVTIHPGTIGGVMETVIGDDCLLMVGSHVAHDCIIGNNVIMANNATMGGHVTIGDFAILGGLSAVHQFVRIGEHAMIGGLAGVTNDIVPYAFVPAKRTDIDGINLVGLRRRGFSSDDISSIREAFNILFFDGSGVFEERVKHVETELGANPAVGVLLSFLNGESRRKFTTASQDTV